MFRNTMGFVVLVLSAAACGGMDSTSSSAPLVIDDRGGRIQTASGLGRLDVPKGALQAPVEIQLVERFDAQGRHEIEVQPAEVRFAKAARLTFKIPDDLRPEAEHAVEVEVQNQVEIETELQNEVCDVLEREIRGEANHGGRFRREDRPL